MCSTKKAIAIIPARGGSKRVPKKNIIDFLGKSMIAYTIEAALKSKCFEHVIVSTDSEEIAAVSREYGAEVPFLREANADDHTPVSVATLGALLQAEEYFSEKYDVVCQLMANCPLRTEKQILEQYEYHNAKKAPATISTFKFGWMNPWWAIDVNADGEGKWVFKDTVKRSQDLPDLYCPTGAIWFAETEALKASQTFYCENLRYFEIPWMNAVDIDSMDDLLFAKCVKSHLDQAGE